MQLQMCRTPKTQKFKSSTHIQLGSGRVAAVPNTRMNLDVPEENLFRSLLLGAHVWRVMQFVVGQVVDLLAVRREVAWTPPDQTVSS